METKTCTKCGEVKALGEFSKHKSGRNGLRAACRECVRNERRAERVKKNPLAKTAEERRSGMSASQRKATWLNKNQEVKARYSKRASTRARETLAGKYVRNLLSVSLGVPRNLISDEVVELKRAQLSIKRGIKRLYQTIKEKQDEH